MDLDVVDRRAGTRAAERQALQLVVRADDRARIPDLDVAHGARAVGRRRAAVERGGGALHHVFAVHRTTRDGRVAVRDRRAAGHDDAAPQALALVGDAAGQVLLRGEDDRLRLGALGIHARAAVDDQEVVIGIGRVGIDQHARRDRQRRRRTARCVARAADVDADIDAAVDLIGDARDLLERQRTLDAARQAAAAIAADDAGVRRAGGAGRGGRARCGGGRRGGGGRRRRGARHDDDAFARRGDAVRAVAAGKCQARGRRQ